MITRPSSSARTPLIWSLGRPRRPRWRSPNEPAAPPNAATAPTDAGHRGITAVSPGRKSPEGTTLRSSRSSSGRCFSCPTSPLRVRPRLGPRTRPPRPAFAPCPPARHLRVYAAERLDLMDDLIRHPAPALVTQPVPDPPAGNGHEHRERHEQISGHRSSRLLNQESCGWPVGPACNMSRSTPKGIPQPLRKATRASRLQPLNALGADAKLSSCPAEPARRGTRLGSRATASSPRGILIGWLPAH